MAQTAEKLGLVSLACREGGSDKLYDAWMEKSGSGYVVNFLYGPRGGWSKPGTKNPEPVSKAEAEKTLEKLIKSKRATGYVEAGSSMPAFSGVEGAVDSGLRPMLLTDATGEDPEEYVSEDSWSAQQKMNGLRLQVIVKGGEVTAVNRKGLIRGVHETTKKALSRLKDCVLDGEAIGEVYHPFDIRELEGVKHDESWMRARVDLLRMVLKGADENHIRLVETFFSEKEKRKLVADLQADRKEGVVFKKVNGIYEPGRRESLKKALAVKLKFLSDGLFKVLRWNKNKQSVEIAAWDEKVGGTDAWVSVGSLTIPTKYVGQVKAGCMVRARYLFATDANQLYQPTVDPTSDGVVAGDDVTAVDAVRLHLLKHEGKEEE